ncbi:MAG: hypothetical protein C5B51_32580 [Terriglobia bacterium]|nr:MAG: hypothetical protein C5B51_32580 [Terriglobia bacterium]
MPLRVSRPELPDPDLRAHLVRAFPNALLLLGDGSAPLLPHTSFWVAGDNGAVVGVAALFRGFEMPVLSLISTDPETARELIDRPRESAAPESLLALYGGEPALAADWAASETQEDVWMTRATAPSIETTAIEITSADELSSFYRKHQMRFWASAMHQFGHCFGFRGHSGELVSAAAVNFIIPEVAYAQIGGVVTDPAWRGKGFARSCVLAVIDSLYRSGIAECGLFARCDDGRLLEFYCSLGFRERGRFHFIGL